MTAAISRRRAEIFSVSPDEPIIHRPLAPEVQLLLDDGQESLLISAGPSQALLKRKTGIDLPLSDFDVIDHIWKVSHDIPAPRPLGAMSVGKRTYIFMSFIEDATLDTQWDSLSNEEKCSIQDQLDTIMKKLRSLPVPSRYLGIGNPPCCVDTRMWTRTSPEYIENEGQFNAFLLGNPDPLKTEPYVEFVRSMLREDHRIVLTHGDLHPRNIMASNIGQHGMDKYFQLLTPALTGLRDKESGSAHDNVFNASLSPRIRRFEGKLITARLCWPPNRPCKRVIDLKTPDDEYNYLEDHIVNNGFDSNNVGPIIQLGEGQYNIRVASSAETKFEFVYSHTRAVHFGTNDRLAHLHGKRQAAMIAVEKYEAASRNGAFPGTEEWFKIFGHCS
ncbi:hypothetical protein ACJ72_08008 [Emergomyces africanus]|uniref:Aminoglycoside phosphotransferase domain-containing protein n=1 Tax=Emergomyces africanus TaxID=1955775 RepID=A0A1B7NM81_9EURO|nr:hypothetical protein ACJ72_08008 [Emergomyces africanus]